MDWYLAQNLRKIDFLPQKALENLCLYIGAGYITTYQKEYLVGLREAFAKKGLVFDPDLMGEVFSQLVNRLDGVQDEYPQLLNIYRE